MNTRYLMIAAAAFLIMQGILLLFFPQEVLAGLSAQQSRMLEIMVQVLSGGILGLGFLDWMARGMLIGGVYGRAVLLGNQCFFLVGGIVLLKGLINGSLDTPYWFIAVPYVLFAAAFSYLFFRHPSGPTA